jgi:hypothetical protein
MKRDEQPARTAPTALTCGLAIVLLSVVHSFGDPPGDTPNATVLAHGSELRLESGYLPLPIRLQGDPSQQEIRSIRIVGKVSSENDGQGEIWLDSCPADLNRFGDVVQRVGPDPGSIHIGLRYLTTGETVVAPLRGSMASVGFRLYDVVFSENELNGHFKLVLGTAILGPHRLLVYGGALPTGRQNPKHPTHILPLSGDPTITSVLPDAPLSPEIELAGYYTAVDGRPHRLEVRGTLGGKGRIAFDPNYITFDQFGQPVASTLIGYWPVEVTLEPLEAPDPLGQGRRLYRAAPVPTQNTNQVPLPRVRTGASYRVTLVLGPTEIGPHRMMVYDGDHAAFALDANLAGRRRQEEAASQYATLSSGEQQAIADLHQSIGCNFDVKIEGAQAIGLNFSGDTARLLPAGVLSRLSHLRSISFSGGHFPAACLADLGQLALLRNLSFGSAQFQPEGLAMLKDLRQLETLSFYRCEGINDEGVGHLASLAGLRELRIYSEEIVRRPHRPEQCVTDAGLGRLERLVRLEKLDLFGHNLSDASLRVLTGMTELQELALSGHGFTDVWLDGLARLPKLSNLRLFETTVTTNGVAALKIRRPELQIEAWGRDSHD